MRNRIPKNDTGKSRFSGWFVKYRWWIIGVLGFFLLFLEIAELIVRGANLVDATEIVIYIAFLWIIGSLIDRVLKALSTQNQTVNLLDHRHKLSLDLVKYDEWEALAEELAHFPSTIAPISQTALYVHSPITKRFELASRWNDGVDDPGAGNHFEICQGCIKRNSKDDFLDRPCSAEKASTAESFCFQINYGYELVAILHLKVKPGEKLTAEQKEIFWNIREEMAVALKAGLDRKRLSELQIAQATLSERRNVSHYLHDHLGQNLGFLNLKLNQLLSEKNHLSLQNVRPDLEHMREAASQSYEIVRGKLETSQPETTPLLTNFLKEHAKKVSARAGFEVVFTTTGEAIPVSEEIQRAVFYVFQEALGNIEKHAGACKVNVLICWSEGNLNVSIKDNGKGFNPAQVQTDKHFGLGIMHERIAKVKGWIEMDSAPNSGTTVSISVPLPIPERNNQGA